jgi:hypothetical protein
MPDAAFADVDHVADRLGYELTDQQRTAAEFLLPAATGLIVLAAGKDDAWAAALDPVPIVLRTVCVEAVVRVISNPEALASYTEEEGGHRSTRTYDGSGALELTDGESALVRQVITGRANRYRSGSARVASMADTVADIYGYVDDE